MASKVLPLFEEWFAYNPGSIPTAAVSNLQAFCIVEGATTSVCAALNAPPVCVNLRAWMAQLDPHDLDEVVNEDADTIRPTGVDKNPESESLRVILGRLDHDTEEAIVPDDVGPVEVKALDAP
jgi:hypothetical protein